MTKGLWAAIAVLAAALAFPAAGVTKTSGGTLNMIAWEGYLQPQWVTPFEKQSGLHDPCEVRAARPTRW